MPRHILQGPQAGSQARAGTSPATVGATPSTRAQLEARLRQKRSSAYVQAMARLDAGTHYADRAAFADLLAAVSAEFPDLTLDQRPLGVVSRCFLGPPYEVHICDLAGQIMEHFESYRPMPPLFEGARSLALHSSYAFIEVHLDGFRAVGPDGTIAVLGARS
jgi:hypothetical protein